MEQFYFNTATTIGATGIAKKETTLLLLNQSAISPLLL
jgi:hypothetical protein